MFTNADCDRCRRTVATDSLTGVNTALVSGGYVMRDVEHLALLCPRCRDQLTEWIGAPRLMPYLNTDDGFPEHDKVDALSDGAFRLHVAGMHFCARRLTDGLIPHARAPRLKPRYKPAELRELITGGLWHDGGKGCGTDECPTGRPGEYVVHDYLQWNKSAAWWQERRETEAKRKADYRARKDDERKQLRIV